MTTIRVAYLEGLLVDLRKEIKQLDQLADCEGTTFAMTRALERMDSLAWRALAAARSQPEPKAWPEDDLAWVHWKEQCKKDGPDPCR